ncbi:MAG: hypothetical protein QF923_05035 [Candidatus Marinimicrobia bacterium]|jgi:hypothetical protein|nr:hypothetical protein [Candidatus Neomarinimicrobiota bacterium]
MKKVILFALVASTIAVSPLAAIGGIGLQLGQGAFTVASTEDVDETGFITVTTGEFANPLNLGVYLYLDVLPIVDLEADIQLTASEYDFEFTNALGTAGPYNGYWGGVSTYITVRKKIFGLGIPFLGGGNLFAGGGYNMHTFAPLADLSLVESLMGDLTEEPTFSEDDLVDFVNENKIDKSGFHVQAGFQFKLLMIDTFVFYRVSFGEFEDIVGDESFGSLNIRLGLGI